MIIEILCEYSGEFGLRESIIFNVYYYTYHLRTYIVYFPLRNHLNRSTALYGFGEMESTDGKGTGDHNNTLAIAI